MNRAPARYYAFEHTYGPDMVEGKTGQPIGTLYWFATAADRQEWLHDDDGWKPRREIVRRRDRLYNWKGEAVDWGIEGRYIAWKAAERELWNAYEEET